MKNKTADHLEMKVVKGKMLAVYTDGDGDEYLLRGGERIYVAVSNRCECDDPECQESIACSSSTTSDGRTLHPACGILWRMRHHGEVPGEHMIAYLREYVAVAPHAARPRLQRILDLAVAAVE